MRKRKKKNIIEIEKQDVYSLMLVLLYASMDNPKYSTLSELAYILDHDSFVKFLKYFEGQTIEIPKLEDCIDSLRVLMLFQFFKVEGDPWRVALKKAGFSDSDTASAKRKLYWFTEDLKKNNYRLGGLLNSDDENY